MAIKMEAKVMCISVSLIHMQLITVLIVTIMALEAKN